MSKVVCLICGMEFDQIIGNHLRTHNITYEEYKERFPDVKMVSEESHQKRSISLKGRKPWNKGKTKETDDRVMSYGNKISKSKKVFYQSDEGIKTRGKMSKSKKVFYQSGEGIKAREKISEDHTGLKASENTKKKMSESLLMFYQTEDGIEFRQQLSVNMHKYYQSEEGIKLRQQLSEAQRGEKNSFYGKYHTEESLRKMLIIEAPNKVEQHLDWLLNEIFPNEYKFVGDGSVIIGGFSPDFINVNGQKKIIEMFGDHWHKGDDEGNRIFQFRLLGFNTLIVWEHEMKDNEIEMTIAKIMEFHFRDKK